MTWLVEHRETIAILFPWALLAVGGLGWRSCYRERALLAHRVQTFKRGLTEQVRP